MKDKGFVVGCIGVAAIVVAPITAAIVIRSVKARRIELQRRSVNELLKHDIIIADDGKHVVEMRVVLDDMGEVYKIILDNQLICQTYNAKHAEQLYTHVRSEALDFCP